MLNTDNRTYLNSVYNSSEKYRTIQLATNIGKTIKGVFKRIVGVKSLVDCGATNIFLNKKIAVKYKIPVFKLPNKIIAHNTDGTQNTAGPITHVAWLKIKIGNLVHTVRALIAEIGSHDLILGMPWL